MMISGWDDVARNPKDDFYKLGKLLSDIPKIVFSKKLKTSMWDSVTILKGDITEQIKTVRRKKGKGIIIYGGDSFVSSLVKYE